VEVLNPATISPANNNTAQVISTALPTQQTVETGLSDDTNIEIISGLSEGDMVVTQIITTAVKPAATTASNSNISIPGLTGGGSGGGNFRTGGMGGIGR